MTICHAAVLNPKFIMLLAWMTNAVVMVLPEGITMGFTLMTKASEIGFNLLHA
jgi:hypothetical protein